MWKSLGGLVSMLVLRASAFNISIASSPFSFERLGYLVHDSSFAHLVVHINVSEVVENQRSILAEFRRFAAVRFNSSGHAYHFNVLFHESIANLGFSIDVGSRLLNELIVFTEIDTPFLEYVVVKSSPPPRPKRQLAFFGSLFNLGIAVAEEAQILHLVAQSRAIQRQQQALVGAVNRNALAITHNANILRKLKTDFLAAAGAIYEEQRVTAALVAIATFFVSHAVEIERLATGIFALTSGHLSPAIIRPSNLFASYESLIGQAAAAGYLPLLSPSRSLFDSDISFARENGSLAVVVHIPVRRDEAFDLYRFVRLPFLITNSTAAIVGADEEFIAINRDHSKVVSLTSAEFAKCHNFNNTHVCPQAAVTKKAPTSTCLGALFRADVVAVRRRCDLKMVIPDEPTAAHIAGCAWRVLLPRSVPFVHACDNGLREVSNMKGELIVVLEQSCNAAVGDSSFACPKSFAATATEAVAIPSDLPNSLIAEGFRGDAAELDRVVAEWYENNADPVDAIPLLQAARVSSDDGDWALFLAIGVSVLVIIVALLGIIACVLRRRPRKRNSRKGNYAEEEVPPLPPQSAMPADSAQSTKKTTRAAFSIVDAARELRI